MLLTGFKMETSLNSPHGIPNRSSTHHPATASPLSATLTRSPAMTQDQARSIAEMRWYLNSTKADAAEHTGSSHHQFSTDSWAYKRSPKGATPPLFACTAQHAHGTRRERQAAPAAPVPFHPLPPTLLLGTPQPQTRASRLTPSCALTWPRPAPSRLTTPAPTPPSNRHRTPRRGTLTTRRLFYGSAVRHQTDAPSHARCG